MIKSSLPWVMDSNREDDIAPKDPGAQKIYTQNYDEKDYEGHRAHTMYVGVHLPGDKQRHVHRRHKHHNKQMSVDSGGGVENGGGFTIPYIDVSNTNETSVTIGEALSSGFDEDQRPITPPSQRVQFILGEEIDDSTHISHPLFSEMEELVGDGEEMVWKETARWIKFEEDVEEGGNRWSKPHVATLSLHSLFELRSLLLNGTVILDMEANCLEQISDLILDNMVNSNRLNYNLRDKVKDTLLRRHRHLYERRKDTNVTKLPIIRSLAEIGRNHSSCKKNQKDDMAKRSTSNISLRQYRDGSTPGSPSAQTALLANDYKGNYLSVPVTPPSQRVQFILGEEIDDSTHISHPLFSEMEELVGDGEEMVWKETARWIKFEEDVEEGGNRWSKPHVATLSLHSLFELRSLLLNGTVILDMEANCLEQISDLILDNMVNSNRLNYNLRDKVKDTLLRRHRHLYERRKDTNVTKLPIIRSLAEIGRNHSSCKRSNNDKSPDEITNSPSNLSINRNASSNDLLNGDGNHRGNLHFMRKIPHGAEASNILVGEVDFLDKTVSAFVRLSSGTIMGDLTEVPVPTRFIFVLLGPIGGIHSFHEIGRAMATLMSDEVFHEVAYRARNRNHLLAGIDEFLDAVTVLPPGEWDPTIRIEPPAAIPSQDTRKRPPPEKAKQDDSDSEDEAKLREESGLARSGRLFGGLINDLKRKAPWYWSDFKDALAVQCIASWIFLYFACLSPIITFGGLLSEATGKNMAAMESLVSGFVCGIGYGFFSGQPLTILGSTGPVLVFETIVYDFCKTCDWDYMSFRFWIGTWIAIILLTLVAIDASALVCYITRFTEENFATLIAFIFIYKAVENVISIGKKNPINNTGVDIANYGCFCYHDNITKANIIWSNEDELSCLATNGTIDGNICPTPHYVPDVFLMSILLFLGTFLLSVEMKDFKNALFFPSSVRQVVSDFAVIIAIFSMSTVDYLVGIPTPKLEVPAEFKPTLEGRGWLIYPFNRNPIWSALLAALPALLGTILIFMDQQITAVIVNRKENKLKKGCGYHLDLFVLAILIQICSIMGLPWFVAATVLSINHVNSLKLESECAAPGEKPQFLGVREQRVTHILIFVMIGLSVLLTPMLSHIPMPVLFGVFLYMGVASLKGLQFFDRILIMFMPNKYQPDYMFLRQVPIRRVHLFTIIQLACLVCLWTIKSFSTTSILFPLMLVVMIGIRKSLDFIFTRRELKILDDIMPETSRRDTDDMHVLENGEVKGIFHRILHTCLFM